ncbi:MAG: family 10 glycosylhydrolase [Anaerolineae bacterium]|nr:family 10 glycosylhydrolase [Anaerolineae bacterium]
MNHESRITHFFSRFTLHVSRITHFFSRFAFAILLLTTSQTAPGAATAETPPDFEALAAQVGRAEAWYLWNTHDTTPDAVAVTAVPLTVTGAIPPVAPLTVNDTFTYTLTGTVYLPFVARELAQPSTEVRALWVTRYDWTAPGRTPTPADLDALVANVANAGFNTIFFQVRAAGDAYYTPGLEPWAARLHAGPVSETLGVNPGWDPLAHMLTSAHTAGLEVHAYVNVYPAWQSPPDAGYGDLWPPATTPPQMFDRFTYGATYPQHPGDYGLGWTWRQYDADLKPMPLAWGQYLWASPGVDQVQEHIVAVVRDIVTRYAVDGIHLDLVRYAGREYSHDPISEAATGTLIGEARTQWQRDRVTTLVQRITSETHTLRPETLVSAAVWPYYRNSLGLNTSSGYDDYYQDSKGWLETGAVDAIAPMLYGNGNSIPDDLENWRMLATDFLTGSEGQVYPGIAGYYDDFDAIARRIALARELGAPGHALFSYSALDARDYWDDLAAGPYRR